MTNLYEVEKESNYLVKSIPNIDLLQSLGIYEGARVYKKYTYSLGGPVVLLIDAREVAIGKDTAILIEVEGDL